MKILIHVCAWCEVGQLYFTNIVDITHGICKDHLSAIMVEIENKKPATSKLAGETKRQETYEHKNH